MTSDSRRPMDIANGFDLGIDSAEGNGFDLGSSSANPFIKR